VFDVRIEAIMYVVCDKEDVKPTPRLLVMIRTCTDDVKAAHDDT